MNKQLPFQEKSLNNASECEDEDEEDIKNTIDQCLGAFFFACNVSFTTVEKPYFLHSIATLIHYAQKNPKFSCKPPCRRTLATKILSEIHQQIQDEKKEMLKNTKCVIQGDGWKNSVNNKKYLVFSLSSIRTALLFLTSYEVSTESEHGEILAAHFNDAI